MPEMTPFRAIRYDADRFGGDLSTVLAPPYDVLGQGDKDALLERSESNVVAVDLPHIPPKSAGPVEVYNQAADRLNEWLTSGVMVREELPALYIYHQQFEHAGQSYTRRMFIARLRLQPFSEGSILPHEKTFGGPKEDRLALMKATECQLSPIFGIYADPEDGIGSMLAATSSAAPLATATLSGVENRMWLVTDGGTIDRVVSAMSERPVYIADGHHRYGTALMYRDFVVGTAGGSLPEDHPANYIMFVLASMDDPGCLILPYNRALADVDMPTVLEAWSDGTERTDTNEADLVLHDGRTGEEVALRFTNRVVLFELAPEECDAWRQLDYAYLHRYLIDELLATKIGRQPAVRYAKSVAAAKRTARDESGVALLTNATPMAHIRAVSLAGALMPQKSTYFYPKLATGLAINPISM
jgi:uncharacterized protein (DUF1015 family)